MCSLISGLLLTSWVIAASDSGSLCALLGSGFALCLVWSLGCSSSTWAQRSLPPAESLLLQLGAAQGSFHGTVPSLAEASCAVTAQVQVGLQDTRCNLSECGPMELPPIPRCHFKWPRGRFAAGSGCPSPAPSLLLRADLWEGREQTALVSCRAFSPSFRLFKQLPTTNAFVLQLSAPDLRSRSPQGLPGIEGVGRLCLPREDGGRGAPVSLLRALAVTERLPSPASQPPADLICHCHLLNNCFSAVWPPRAALPATLLRAPLICSVNSPLL